MKKLGPMAATAILCVLALLSLAWILMALGTGSITLGGLTLVTVAIASTLALIALVMHATRDFAERQRLLSDILRARAAANRVCFVCGRSLTGLPLRGTCPDCGLRYDHKPQVTCLRCGYSLVGLARRGQCPECGSAYDLDDRRRLIGLVPEGDEEDPDGKQDSV